MKTELKESLGYIFFKNPVLVLGLVLGHLAAGDINLQNAAALSVTFLFITVPVMLFAATIGKKIPDGFNMVCYALFSAAMLVPAYLFAKVFPQRFSIPPESILRFLRFQPFR